MSHYCICITRKKSILNYNPGRCWGGGGGGGIDLCTSQFKVTMDFSIKSILPVLVKKMPSRRGQGQSAVFSTV